MIWTIFISVYVLVAAFSMFMTLRESTREGYSAIWGTLLGMAACAFWPVTIAVMSVSIYLDRTPQRSFFTESVAHR